MFHFICERKCLFLDRWKHLWLLSGRGWLLKTSHLVGLRSGYVAIVQSYSIEPLYTLSVGVWLNEHLDYQKCDTTLRGTGTRLLYPYGYARGRSAQVGFGIAVYKTKLSVVFLRRTRPAWGQAGGSCPAAGWTCGRATGTASALDRLVGRRHQGLVRRLGDPHGQVVAHRVRRHEGVLVGVLWLLLQAVKFFY